MGCEVDNCERRGGQEHVHENENRAQIVDKELAAMVTGWN